MRNRFSALMIAGLLALGAVACDMDDAGTDIEAPADGGVVDPAPPADGGVDDGLGDDGLGDDGLETDG